MLIYIILNLLHLITNMNLVILKEADAETNLNILNKTYLIISCCYVRKKKSEVYLMIKLNQFTLFIDYLDILEKKLLLFKSSNI